MTPGRHFERWYRKMQKNKLWGKFIVDLPIDSNGAWVIQLAFLHGYMLGRKREGKK